MSHARTPARKTQFTNHSLFVTPGYAESLERIANHSQFPGHAHYARVTLDCLARDYGYGDWDSARDIVLKTELV